MLAGAVSLSLVAAAGLAGTAMASSGAARHALPGSVPSWAKAATKVGDAPQTDHVGFRVYLGWQNPAAAEALAASVATPGSANYGKYLTPAQFRAEFAPSQADVTAVQQWLRGAGFTVDYTPSNNHYVSAEGTVAQAEAAFGTTMGLYSEGGLTLHSPESELSVPSSLNAVVGVLGLDDSAALVSHTPDAPPSPAFVNGKPCSDYYGQKTTANTATLDGTVLPGTEPFAVCGYTPSQLQSAYGVAPAVAAGNDGRGQTVAIIDAYASPTILQDADAYAAAHGQPRFTGGQFSQQVAPGTYKRPVSGANNPKKGPVQDPQGWYGEETLDVEAVHAIAPGADIVYVGAPNNYQDLDAALNEVVDKHLATMVTNSYGFSSEALPNGYIKPFQDSFIQAAATGIGVYFSSGDNGDETAGDPANAAAATPDWPASSPWVTAVGGTSLGVGSAGQYLFETGWETGRSTLSAGSWSPSYPGTYLYGSGGGTSRLFAQPAYQAGVVPASISQIHGGAPMRAVPDVAALGDPTTGMLVGQTQSFPDGTSRYSEYRIGGTSLASPLTAGFMALAQQKAGHVLGFANPLIYAEAGSGAYRDVAASSGLSSVRAEYANGIDASGGYVYTLRSLGFDANLTIHARTGYDDVTGIGTPNGAAFLNALGS
ncbi:MAG: S8/S53 family peptidase [Catenulispora sp.]|nr:S8/S53 family peptidase [Catenulispora sp.]